MSAIKRTDLKYNFLKNIIVRIDFQGVFEPEMEKLLPLIKPYLKSKNFSRYERKKNNQIEINVPNIDSQQPSFGKVQSQDVHSFINEDKGYVLDVSNSFVCLNISSTGYSPFEDYSVLVSEIAEIYKHNIDFFTVTRVGVRKINVCMIENKKRIRELFSQDYFGYFTAIDGVNTHLSNRRDTFSINEYKGNLSCNIEQGSSGDRVLYKLDLDIDIYVDDIDVISKTTFNTDKLKEMNDVLFDIYVKALTEEFKNALAGDDESKFDGLIGVERNE